MLSHSGSSRVREKIRTPDLLIRSQTLYPAELRAHFFLFRTSCPSQQNYSTFFSSNCQHFFFKNLNLTIKNVRISQKNMESTGISQTAFFPERRLYYGNKTSAKAQRLCDVFAGSRHRCARQHPLTMTIVIPIFLAILSIMFGLLSRGNTSMSNHALAGVIVACSALLINIAVGGFSFFIVFSNSDAKQQYWTMVNDTYEQMTGLTFDEILNEYGIELPESLHD